MLFGVREICDVVLRAKSAQKIGNKIFYKNEPVCYFDTLKTSTLEGAATTVYAQGGRGNARLMSWDGERTVTFTMEDALISPIGLSILTGAGLIEATTDKPVVQHIIETVRKDSSGNLYVSHKPKTSTTEPMIYAMILNDNGEVDSEPYLCDCTGVANADKKYQILIGNASSTFNGTYNTSENPIPEDNTLAAATTFLLDYYTEHNKGAFEVNITPDKFGGTFYLEASTLWRDKATGKDLPAEFIIPSCKVQSNFTFTMSSSGDPSTFTFTMDAFPDHTRWGTEKVLADIQVIGANLTGVEDPTRDQTWTTRVDPEDQVSGSGAAAPIIDAVAVDYASTALTLTLTFDSDADTYDALHVLILDTDNNVLANTYTVDTSDLTFTIGSGKTGKVSVIAYNEGVASNTKTATFGG